jgi:hypothetical protein
MGAVTPRETATIHLALSNVGQGFRELQATVERLGGRIVAAQLNEQDPENIVGQIDFEVQRDQQEEIDAAMEKLGDVHSRVVSVMPNQEHVIDSKIGQRISLVSQSQISPRETMTMEMEVKDVDQVTESVTGQVVKAKGRVLSSDRAQSLDGRKNARITVQVPQSAAAEVVEKMKSYGVVRSSQSTRNRQILEHAFSVAQIDLVLSNAELIVPQDSGIWYQIRKGLSTSFVALSWSLVAIIVGICFVLPWTLVLYGIYRLIRRFQPRPAV